MNIINAFKDPKKRCFSEEIVSFSTEKLQSRLLDIERFQEYGVYPNWAACIYEGNTFVDYWEPYDLYRYRKAIYMELLDRCKSFEMIPKLKFTF